MKWLSAALAALLIVIGSSCSRDPEVVKRKYVENGNRYFERGKYKEASIMYRSALNKDRRYGEAYYRLGLTQLKLRQSTMAVRSFLRAVETMPAGPGLEDARKTLADLYLGAYIGDPKRNQILKKDLLKIAKDLEERDPRSFDAFRVKGYLARVDGKTQEALAYFQKANEVKPMDPDLILALSQALIAEKRPEEGEKLAKALIEKEKSFYPIYQMLVTLYVTQKRLADAENVLKLLVANNPKEAAYRIRWSSFYFATQRPGDGDRVLKDLLARAKEIPNAYAKVGDIYRQIREFDKALEVFRAGINAKEGKKVEFQQWIAEVLAVQGKRPESFKILEDILKGDPENAPALALRATLVLESGDKAQAQAVVSALESAVKRMPGNAVIRFNLGRALTVRGDLDQARIQFEEAVKLRADYLPARLWLAQVQLQKGEYAKSLQSALEVRALDRNNLEARLIQALSLREVGNFDQARRELVDIVSSNPTSITAQFQLGLLDLTQRNYKEAEKTFQKCVEPASKDLSCLIGLVNVYSQQLQFDRAMQLLSDADKRVPGNNGIRMALANTAVTARKFDVGIGIYKELLAKDPKSTELHLRLGEAFRRKGESDSAIGHFAKARDLNPSDARIYVPLGMLYDVLGRKSDAKLVYEQAIRLQPDNALALNNLAYLIAETGGDLDLALTYAQRAKQKFPKDPNVSDTLGWIYTKKNLSTNALQIYKDLVTTVPTNPTYRYHMGVVLYQKGDKAQAKRELETALRIGPSKEEADKIRELIAKIG